MSSARPLQALSRVIVAGLLLSLLTPATAPAQFFNPATNHWYEVGDAPVDVIRAREFAARLGGFLVTINDQAEQDWVVSNISLPPNSGDRVFLGISDELTEGVFLWDSGEPVSFNNLDPADNAESADFGRLRLGTLEWDLISVIGVSIPLIETDQPVPTRLDLLTCAPEGSGVRLNWVAGETYDQVEIYRGSDLIATLAGGETTYFDDEPTIPESEYFVNGRVGGLASYPVRCESLAEDPSYLFEVTDAVVPQQAVFTLSVLLDAPGPLAIDGSSYQVAHDPSALELISVEFGAAVLALDNMPMFSNTELNADHFVTGSVYINVPPGSNSIPAGMDLELTRATYRAISPTPQSTTVEIEVGVVPPPVVIVSGAGILPARLTGEVEIVEVQFSRGDCTANGTLDIADAITIGNYLFLGAEVPPCLASCDSNGDGAVDVADVIFSLLYLFQQGQAPAAPFPGCEAPPAMPSLACDSVVCP